MIHSVCILLVLLCTCSVTVANSTSSSSNSIHHADASSARAFNVTAPRPLPYEVLPLSASSFAIYVPSTHSLDRALPFPEYDSIVQGLAGMLVEMAGGCTATPALGYYKANSGKVVRERVTILHTFVTLTESVKEELQMMAYDLAHRLQQESVLILMDGMPVLLTPLRRIDQLWMEDNI